MHRYLAQFRDQGQQHFKNGCGFDGFDEARRYVALVMEALGWIAEGRSVQFETRPDYPRTRPGRRSRS